MKNTNATINGLMNGVSVLETNKNEQLYLPSDIIYNEQETGCTEIFPNFDYQSLYMDCISLLSLSEE